MSAPIRATAGVAFRLPVVGGPLDEETDQLACAAWWAAHVDLLRRLLSAQPTAAYPWHELHLTVLRVGEDLVRHFGDVPTMPPKSLPIMRKTMEEVLTDFGPAYHRFGPHPENPSLVGWWPQLDDSPTDSLFERDIAVRMRIAQRISALAAQEAELPSPAKGTPALSAASASPLAAVYYDTPLAGMPQEVIDLLVDITDAAGNDMT